MLGRTSVCKAASLIHAVEMAAAEELLFKIIHNLDVCDTGALLPPTKHTDEYLANVVKDVCYEVDLKMNDLTELRIALASLGAIVEVVNQVMGGEESGNIIS